MFSKKGKNRQNEEQDILNSTDTELMEEIDLLDEPQDEERDQRKNSRHGSSSRSSAMSLQVHSGSPHSPEAEKLLIRVQSSK